jgi:hypothetical protein
MDSISAHHRPSSSRPTVIGIDSSVVITFARLQYSRPRKLSEGS